MPPPNAKIATLENQYRDDRVLRRYLERTLPTDVLRDIERDLIELGELSGGELHDLQLADRTNRPELIQWDATGNRIDHVELTGVWKRAHALAAEYGLVATPYEQTHGAYSRIHQFAMAHLLIPPTDMVSFVLATTDGAARTLQESGNQALINEVLPHLVSRSPEAFWTSGQWRTEQTGGSDLSRIKTEARREDGTWRLYGRKWFTPSSIVNIALVLAKPQRDDVDDLALFYLPIRTDGNGVADGVRVNRLKDSLGARKIPVSDVQLDGAACRPVSKLSDGRLHLTDMVELARTWTSVMATSFMRRGIALARDFGRKRKAFGTPIIEKPLHYDTMASMQSTYEAAFHLTFRLVELIGKQEAGEMSVQDRHLLHALTPIVKLTTAKQAVNVMGEVMEAFGGAGYVEETGIPLLLRDVYALPLWEGTTNVLSLISLQTLRRDNRLAALKKELQRCADAVEAPALQHATDTALAAFRNAVEWLATSLDDGQDAAEAGARRFALTIGHALELALLARHAQWAMNQEGSRATAVVEHFAAQGIDFISPRQHYDGYRLAQDQATQSLFQM